MADQVIKFAPEQKAAPEGKSTRKIAAEPRRRMMAGLRRYRRSLLLVVLPIAAAPVSYTHLTLPTIPLV